MHLNIYTLSTICHFKAHDVILLRLLILAESNVGTNRVDLGTKKEKVPVQQGGDGGVGGGEQRRIFF